MKSHTHRWHVSVSIAGVLFGSQAFGALVLNIDEATNDLLTITISGTFDETTVGDLPGYLALKRDWTGNEGVNTEFFLSTPTIALNTVMIDSKSPSTAISVDNLSYGDSFLFRNTDGGGNNVTGTAFAAGTTVSGTVTFTGTGIIDPTVVGELQLVSGFNTGTTSDFARLEAVASPEPSSTFLLGIGALAIGLIRRRTE
ncbi:PEP-CTERM sorting domain-containing protein [Akkermansiaceae bacterium]|nr:PEP-CTERM sorting domain-containing protein [Akkermansiaceae bacterium]MDB4313846.1 PEP-CTERM sorting domain-containing protein [Akkermansiaceae bacterium]